MEKRNTALDSIYQGVPTRTRRMPGGFDITFREQNGDDEDVLSKYKDSMDGSSMHKFISGIIMDNSMHPGQPTPPSEVLSWKLKDKYYLMLCSRLFSLGSQMIFTYKFQDGTEEIFEEDLSIYDWDLNKDILTPLDKDGKSNPKYFKHRITPFKNGGESVREITLSSKKVVRYEYITGMGEKLILDKKQDDLSKNDELRCRNLQLNIEGKFQTMETFKLFSSRDMQEIRSDINNNDSEFKVECELRNPNNGTIEAISLISLPDFFFPLIQAS